MDKVQNKPNSSVQHKPSSESFQVYQGMWVEEQFSFASRENTKKNSKTWNIYFNIVFANIIVWKVCQVSKKMQVRFLHVRSSGDIAERETASFTTWLHWDGTASLQFTIASNVSCTEQLGSDPPPLTVSLATLTRRFHLTEGRMDTEFTQKSVLMSVWNFMQTISQEDEGRSLCPLLFKLHLGDAIIPEILKLPELTHPLVKFHMSLGFRVIIQVHPFTGDWISFLNYTFLCIISMAIHPDFLILDKLDLFHGTKDVYRKSVETFSRPWGDEACYTAYLRALFQALLFLVLVSLFPCVTTYEIYFTCPFMRFRVPLGLHEPPRIRTPALNNGN
jgi:hypothetical protein